MNRYYNHSGNNHPILDDYIDNNGTYHRVIAYNFRELDLPNCKNCGAPLHDFKCEYCGTEYSQS